MSDLLSWLRSTIEGDKAAAELAASGEHNGVAFTGHWTFTHGDDVVYQDGRRIPGGEGIVSRSCDCCGPASAGHAEDLAHIALHDPRDTIARCEAELALLDEFIPIVEELDYIAYSEGLGSLPYGEPQRRLLKTLASGYRHRPGFNPDWVSD